MTGNRTQQTLLDELVSGQAEWANDFNRVGPEAEVPTGDTIRTTL